MRTVTLFALLALPAVAPAGVAPLLPRFTEAGAARLRPAPEPADPAEPESPAAIAERIVANGNKASERLQENDSGMFTQKTQQEILNDIDKLLNPPPPPPMSESSASPPPPMGGMPPPGGGPPKSRQQQRQQQRAQEQGQGNPMPMGGQPMGGQPMGGQPMGGQPMGGQPMGGQPMGGQPMGGQPMGGQSPGDGPGPGQPPPPPPAPAPDDAVTKQVWGHLPERLRQEVNQYYRERFMPKYSDMLRQYYGRLAERDGGKR